MSWLRSCVATLVTLLVFYAIFRYVDVHEVWGHVAGMRYGYFAAALALLAGSSLLSIERLRWLLAGDAVLPLGTSARTFLAASTLNLVLPSKVGDLGKAFFLKQEGVIALTRGGNIIVLEKLLDLSALCALYAAGILLVQRFDALTGALGLFSLGVVGATALFLAADHERNWVFGALLRLLQKRPKLHGLVIDLQHFVKGLRADRRRFWGILLMSLVQWALHLLQVFLFFRAMRADVSLVHVLGLVPLALLIGLLPVTLGGMGTRDAALIGLFSPYAPAALTAGVGMLVSMRLWLLAVMGLPYLRRYMAGRGD